MKTEKMSARLMQGNEAIAEGAIAAGVTFFAGYPITPSTEIAEQMAALLPKIGGTFLQMEDEIGAMGAILGASLAGAKVMDATSGPGFSLKQELIGYAACAEIPCVLVNVQRAHQSVDQLDCGANIWTYLWSRLYLESSFGAIEHYSVVYLGTWCITNIINTIRKIP